MKGPLAGLAIACLLVLVPSAGAKVPSTLDDPASCDPVSPAPSLTVQRCDDGVPPTGGRTPNPGGAQAVTAPAKYRGYVGLPAKAPGAKSVPGADDQGHVALDADVTLPSDPAPAGGYPLLVFMHGCCSGDKTTWEADSFDAGGERWHYSDSWFAAHGFAVLTYTARGFVNGSERGSTGETHIDARNWEINDLQSLACQLDGAADRFSDVTGQQVSIDPKDVVVTGGSYGGGLSWMALTDPKWHCPQSTGAGGTTMKLSVAAPKYGWSDLVYSLVPTGAHFQEPDTLPATNGCDSGPLTLHGKRCPKPHTPEGLPKRSITNALYLSGTTGIPPGTNHTTFPPSIDEAFSCLSRAYPTSQNPDCRSFLRHTLPQFLRERSPYYQNRFFGLIAGHPGYRTPVFDAATLTDPLFTSVENRRMINRLRDVVPDYPVQAYYGDYQHFTQNKAKVWGDTCGEDHHVCTLADYPGGDYDSDPPTLVRKGVTTRLDRFVDHYAKPAGDPDQPQPDFDVTAELEVCPQNASDLGVAADEGGPQFAESTFEELAPNVLHLDLQGDQATTAQTSDPHAAHDDPVNNLISNGGKCPVETLPAGPGVASYESGPLGNAETMIGSTRVSVRFDPTPSAIGVELNARLYDVYPNGSAVMVDRGPRRLSSVDLARGRVSYELHGNGWRFEPGHDIRIELTQDDDPFVAHSSFPSSLTVHGADLRIPVR